MSVAADTMSFECSKMEEATEEIGEECEAITKAFVKMIEVCLKIKEEGEEMKNVFKAMKNGGAETAKINGFRGFGFSRIAIRNIELEGKVNNSLTSSVPMSCI
jgi:hypothetical protein